MQIIYWVELLLYIKKSIFSNAVAFLLLDRKLNAAFQRDKFWINWRASNCEIFSPSLGGKALALRSLSRAICENFASCRKRRRAQSTHRHTWYPCAVPFHYLWICAHSFTQMLFWPAAPRRSRHKLPAGRGNEFAIFEQFPNGPAATKFFRSAEATERLGHCIYISLWETLVAKNIITKKCGLSELWIIVGTAELFFISKQLWQLDPLIDSHLISIWWTSIWPL